LSPIFCFSQTVPYRQYKPGETYKFRLTSEVNRNNSFSAKMVSVSEHKVVKDSGILAEEIRWLSKKTFTSKDTTSTDSIARKVNPYRISLSPKGKVPLPKLTIPEMTGDITDLNTFFVAIAPALNAQQLSSQKTTITGHEPREGNFADS